MKKLFAAVLIAMLVVLPMTAFASATYNQDTGRTAAGEGLIDDNPIEKNLTEPVDPKDPDDENDVGAMYAPEEFLAPIAEPAPMEAAPEAAPAPVEAEVVEAAPAPAVPETGVFAAVAASAALLAMGLATAKKN